MDKTPRTPPKTPNPLRINASLMSHFVRQVNACLDALARTESPTSRARAFNEIIDLARAVRDTDLDPESPWNVMRLALNQEVLENLRRIDTHLGKDWAVGPEGTVGLPGHDAFIQINGNPDQGLSPLYTASALVYVRNHLPAVIALLETNPKNPRAAAKEAGQ